MNFAADLKHASKCRMNDATFPEDAPAADCSCGAVLDFMRIPQRLYDSEINFAIECFWDGGWDVKLGDNMNGWIDETNVRTYVEALAWLDREVRAGWPDSYYATGKQPDMSAEREIVSNTVIPPAPDDRIDKGNS